MPTYEDVPYMQTLANIQNYIFGIYMFCIVLTAFVVCYAVWRLLWWAFREYFLNI